MRCRPFYMLICRFVCSRCFHCQGRSDLEIVVNVQVLQCVPPEHEHEVFVGCVAESETAFKQPASLLSKWVTSSTGLDLRSVDLSSEQLVKLSVAIRQAPPGAVRSLHVKMPQEESKLMVAMSALQNIVAHTTHLQCLGLYRICPRAEYLPNLTKIFFECPGSLAKLVLDTDGFRSLSKHEKTNLFEVVAQVLDTTVTIVGFQTNLHHLSNQI